MHGIDRRFYPKACCDIWWFSRRLLWNRSKNAGIVSVKDHVHSNVWNLKRLFSFQKCRILGPKCVISCLMDNVTLPDINSPMYGLSMRNLIVCLSSFDAKEKVSRLSDFEIISTYEMNAIPFATILGKSSQIHRLHGRIMHRSIGWVRNSFGNRECEN